MTTAGKKPTYRERVVPFTAGDGMSLNLVNVRGSQQPKRGPVLLVHGAGVRANLFRAPVETNFVDALIDHGYDVWLENWRASIEVEPNHWTLDQAALYDHPKAVQQVVQETDCETIKAVIHCQGSTSFTMSSVAGLVPQVETIVSNAVSLHLVVPRWSKVKLRYILPLASLVMPYINPHWGVRAPTLIAKSMKWLVKLFHHECNNDVCKMVSFIYGSGFPALWRHENLDEATHEWIKDEFGPVTLRFFKQMARCIKRGHLVAYDRIGSLPTDYLDEPPRTEARFAFFAGGKSRCFLPQSQVYSHRYFSSFRPHYHTLHLLPDYSHLDVFIGKHAARDVFPAMIDELDLDRHAPNGKHASEATLIDAASAKP